MGIYIHNVDELAVRVLGRFYCLVPALFLHLVVFGMLALLFGIPSLLI